ncbi:MAG: hypothetical protein ABSC41_08930 [Acidimicrobiales bacterium]
MFANGFTDEPLIAGATAGIALAAFFGWVVKGLRATTRKPQASTPQAVAAAAVPASTPPRVVAAAAAPASTPEHVVAAAGPASTPEHVVAAAGPASTPQLVVAAAAPEGTPELVVAAASAAPASTPQRVAAAAAEDKVRIETRPATPPTGIVGLLFSGPPAAVPRRTARMRRMTTSAGSIGDILDLRPEGEPDPENVKMLTG